ncbi:MAG: hypothetical protein LJI21_00450 [Wolbachia endosymbiont of Menacanthus eurysternus]|nr:MAG: hypothetical protein LJI21_00450 [Wolbachia endosymbiont of Menacanthus eurysternus]
MNFVVATFYHFVELLKFYDVFVKIRDKMKVMSDNFGLRGTILLAKEGINATISGKRDIINEVFDFLRFECGLELPIWKESIAEHQPFNKMKVKLKREIVNFGIGNLNISLRGEYIDPEHWDDFILQPNVLVIDVRNEYEVKLGKFKNAINPHIQYFREFPRWVEFFTKNKDMKLAMYCTGGIRCEKSTAYMRSLGFNNVYQLRGGILSYFEKTCNKNNNWEGECFVFDNRIAVDNFLVPSRRIKCIFCSSQILKIDELKSVSRGKVVCSSCRVNMLAS